MSGGDQLLKSRLVLFVVATLLIISMALMFANVSHVADFSKGIILGDSGGGAGDIIRAIL